VHELVPVLQVAIGPVILVSGVGLLLLAMTNRLGRIVDRARFLYRELAAARDAERERTLAQMRILRRRALLVQRAIALATLSVLLSAGLVIVLFTGALLRLQAAWLAVLLFMAAMASLIVALVLFLADVRQSLRALELEWGADLWRRG
jgi:hypothetical protein